MSDLTPERRVSDAYADGGDFPPAPDSWFMTQGVGKYLAAAIREAEERGYEAGCKKTREEYAEICGQLRNAFRARSGA